MTKICGHCGNSLIVKAIIVGRGGLTYVPVQGVQYTRALHELEPPLVVGSISILKINIYISPPW